MAEETDGLDGTPCELITYTEFAKRVGVSRPRISQLVQEGKLPTEDGKIPWVSGRVAWDLHRSTCPPKKPDPEVKTMAGVLAPVLELRPRERRPTSAELAQTTTDTAQALAKARAADKVFQAKTRELKYEVLKGTLVPREDVDSDAANVGTMIVSTLRGIAPKLAPLLAGRVMHAPDIEETISREIETAIAHLYEARYKPGKEP